MRSWIIVQIRKRSRCGLETEDWKGEMAYFEKKKREKINIPCSVFAPPQRLIDLDEWRQTLVEKEIRKIHETGRRIGENNGTMET